MSAVTKRFDAIALYRGNCKVGLPACGVGVSHGRTTYEIYVFKRLDQLDGSGNEILVSIYKRRVDLVTASVKKENADVPEIV